MRLISLAAAIALLTLPCLAAENPCTNGSFETLDEKGFPADWGAVGQTVEASSDAHSGQRSLRMARAAETETPETGLNRGWKPDSGEQGKMIGRLKGGIDFWYKAVSAERALVQGRLRRTRDAAGLRHPDERRAQGRHRLATGDLHRPAPAHRRRPVAPRPHGLRLHRQREGQVGALRGPHRRHGGRAAARRRELPRESRPARPLRQGAARRGPRASRAPLHLQRRGAQRRRRAGEGHRRDPRAARWPDRGARRGPRREPAARRDGVGEVDGRGRQGA